MNDLEIAKRAKYKNIKEIGKEVGFNDLVCFSFNKAKINDKAKENKGKLILVTAVTPTPFGEGKTTVSIGLGDALHKLKQNVLICLRQPSMGPVFGLKGGATGGGYSQVIPMDEINLHFTGDFHAITSANNLLSAAIDNHIYQGNELKIKKVTFQRCLDVNDRALRKVKLENRDESFNITSASEIMALFCLANSLDDLKKRLGNIIIGYNDSDNPVFARDLKIEGALTVILKDAFKPNLVQTLENTPTIIHGGPFANIAHGCNSVVATKLSLSYADYVVTEAGFAEDLGAEKFLNIKCKNNDIFPSAIVLVATVKALNYSGFENLKVHVENLKKYNVPLVVCLNKYKDDKEEEIEKVKKYVENLNVSFSVSTAYQDGGEGAISLAKTVIEKTKEKNNFSPLYSDDMNIKEKINILCKEIYHAGKVNYSDLALKEIEKLEKLKLDKYPICVAKTQYSISDDPKKIGYPKDYEINVKNIRLYNGAGFITVYLGNIMTMPGLPKKPNYEEIDLIGEEVTGIF